MRRLHLEILDSIRKDYFSKLAHFKGLGYLAGGTALALQIGHRVSYDFDVFCSKEINQNQAKKITEVIPIQEVLVNSSDELSFLTKEGVKFSLVYYPFDLNKFLVRDLSLPISMLSIQGIAATKAYALNRRASWRDYLDLYVIIKHFGVTLSEIVKNSKEIYGGLFSEKLFFAQLVYTEDISEKEIQKTKLLNEEVSLSEVKAFFEKGVKKEAGIA